MSPLFSGSAKFAFSRECSQPELKFPDNRVTEQRALRPDRNPTCLAPLGRPRRCDAIMNLQFMLPPYWNPILRCNEPPVSRPVLNAGSFGQIVRELQAKLNMLIQPVPPLVIDGEFGAHTKHAVRALQRTHKLTADGIVDEQTWLILDHVPPATIASAAPSS